MKTQIILKTGISIFTWLMLLAVISACKKSKTNTTPVPVTADHISLDNLFANNKAVAQTATFNNNTGGVLTGNGGSRLIIQPNSFVYANGQPVTGNVTVQFTDYTNRADMIFSKVLPVSNGEPLISGGEYFLAAKQGNTEVFIAPGKTTEVRVPQFGNNGNNMMFFRGRVIEPNEMNNIVNWVKQDSVGMGAVVYNGDTISIFNDSMGYANADKFIPNPNYVEFNIQVTGAQISDSTFSSYCLYQDYNGLWPIYQIAGNGLLTATHIPDIPVHLVVYGYDKGEFYTGMVIGYMPVNGATVNMTLSKSDPVTLKNLLKNL